jgi:hypothetical protein
MSRPAGARPLAAHVVAPSLAACLLTLGACNKGAPAAAASATREPSNVVSLTADEAAKLGIVTIAARPALYHSRGTGYGTIVGLETVAQSFTEVSTASAAAAQSTAAAARARNLAGGEEAAVSQEALESAQSKALADQAALLLAQRKSDATFGPSAPWRTRADRDRILHTLATGRAVLARVTFPLGVLGSARPESIELSRIGTPEPSWSTRLLWPAPADPAVPGTSFYTLLEGSDLAQGEHVAAWTGVGAALRGVWIPQSAILLSESDTWAYVQSDRDHFKRVRIDVTHPDRDGYFIEAAMGIAPDQRVVIGGAGLLLSRELNPGNGGGD